MIFVMRPLYFREDDGGPLYFREDDGGTQLLKHDGFLFIFSYPLIWPCPACDDALCYLCMC